MRAGRSACAKAQANLRLHWAHMIKGTFSTVAAKIKRVWVTLRTASSCKKILYRLCRMHKQIQHANPHSLRRVYAFAYTTLASGPCVYVGQILLIWADIQSDLGVRNSARVLILYSLTGNIIPEHNTHQV